MSGKTPLNVVVLGGGPSGLSAAWNLVQDGHKVTLIDKAPVCGGMAKTFQRGNYSYDLGPHNIHPQRASIINFLKKSIGEEFIQHDYKAEIYFRGQRISYPFDGPELLKSMDWFTTLSCAASFLSTRFLALFTPHFKDDGSFEKWVINRFGKKFYSIYFGPYSEKVWGVSPVHISDIVAKKRIAVRGVIELIHSVIFKKEYYHPENPSTIQNFYPKKGVGMIAEYFVKGIQERGGRIFNNSTAKKIIMDGTLVKGVEFEQDGETRYIDFANTNGQFNGALLSSIPINSTISMIEGDVPEPVVNAAKELDYVAMVLLYLNVKRKNVFNVPLMYFSESVFPFNRIYDVGIFSRQMVPEDKNALCLEMTCNIGDETWKADDKTLFQKCIEPLEKYKLIRADEVEDYHTQRLGYAYPRFRVGYDKKLTTIFNYIDSVPNLLSFGRQGLFSYANVDDAIWMGFQVAKQVNFLGQIDLPLKELLPNYIDF